MVSKKLRKVRKGVQERKQAAKDRVKKARFKRELTKSKVRESAPVKEAKESKEELTLLGRELAAPAKAVGQKIAAAGQRAQTAVETLDDEFGDPTRAGGDDVRELASKGVEQGVKAGDTAFKNKIKRQAKKRRVEQLEAAGTDDFGMAGDDFGTDLEVVDDFQRGDPGGMGELGFDAVFDAEPGVGILGERDPDDLEVIGEIEAIDEDIQNDLGGGG